MYLGMDVGTSGVKAVLVNEAGAIVATASCGLALSHPAPLFSEQDPDAWVDAAIARRRQSCRRPSARNGGGSRHRAFRSDARRHAARRRRPAAAPGHSLERRPLSCRVRRTRTAVPLAACDRGQSCDARLHRAQAVVGGAARAGSVRKGRQGSAAQGLCPLPLDRRDGRGHVGCGRNALARRRPALLVRDDSGSDRARSRPHAATGRRQRSQCGSSRRLRAALGHGTGCGGRRRRRRLRGQRDRARRHCAGRCVPVARDVGRAVPRHGPVCAGACFGRPRFLPRAWRSVAPDGRDVVGRGLAGLACAHPGNAGSRTARPARRGRRTAEPGAVSALSRRRAHAAQ